MRGHRLVMSCAFLAFFGTTPARAQSGVAGRWLTDDRAGVVEIAPCDAMMCGKLVAVYDPKAPRQDVNNPDPALRSRPLLGVPILSGLSRKGDGWAGGRVYDPKGGRTYRASIRLGPQGTLDVTGCVLLVCRTHHWTRAPENNR